MVETSTGSMWAAYIATLPRTLAGPSTTRREPLYFKKLGVSVVKPSCRVYDRQPADRFQCLLELLTPQNGSHKFHVIYPSVS